MAAKYGFGNITDAELKNIQSGLLALLLEFDSICREHGLTYYLDGGSVIGALRHEGFIPWDDDIDLLMKRSEFNKLIFVLREEVRKRNNRVFSYMGEVHTHHHPFARYINTEILHVVRSAITEAQYPPGVFLDIFILDPVPAGKLRDHTRKLEESEEWFHKRLNGVVGRMPYWKYQAINALEYVLGERRLFRYFDKQLSAYTDEEADYYVPRNGFNYAVYDDYVFDEPRYVKFEGYELPVPSMPEKYLRTHYSIDWFCPPPIDARYSEHYTITGIGISGEEFQDIVSYVVEQQKIFSVQEKRHKYQVRRKRPLTAVKAAIARLRAVCDTVEVKQSLRLYSKGDMRRRLSAGNHESLAEIFALFYDKQLQSEYLEHGIALNLDPAVLPIALETLLNNGRLFDAQRILSLHGETDGRLRNVAQRIAAGIHAEIQEQDAPASAKPIIRSMETVDPAELPIDLLADGVYRKQLQLLQEFHALCERHGINYTLFGRMLVAAVRDGTTSDAHGPISVAMAPSQYKKFLQLSEELPDNRCFEHVFNNSFYPGLSARYVATDTTNYKVTSPWFKAPGVFITIRVLREPADSPTVDNIWAAISKYKKAFCLLPGPLRWMGWPLCVLHKSHVRRLLLRDPENTVIRVGSHKNYTKIELSSEHLREYTSVRLDDYEYKVVRLLPDVLEREAPGMHYMDLHEGLSTKVRIVSLAVPYQEYLRKISATQLYRCYFHGFRAYRLLRKIRRVEKSPYAHKHYLPRVAFAFQQFKMWHEYKPLIDQLTTLLSNDQYDELEVLLQPYSEWFRYFYNRGRVLVGHPAAFASYIELIRWQGNETLAEDIMRQVHRDPLVFEAEQELL